MACSKSQYQSLHFIMLPLMAPGHMIPIIDMAKQIAKYGITVSIITTPNNAARFKPTIHRATTVSGLDVRLCQLEFPSSDIGLPDGCENIDMLPSLSLAYNFIHVANKLQEPMENLLREMKPKPSCIISDMGFHWTNEIAMKFDIPRIVFHGTSCFSLMCLHNLEDNNFLGNIKSEIESFVIPDLPDKIEISKNKLPNSVKLSSSDKYERRRKMREAEREAFGVVVNSFKELEPVYFERYREAKGMSVWCVGPVSLCSQDNFDNCDRGNKTAIDRDQCLQWLDLQDSVSVVYVCFGSLCNLVASQIMEIALGLEESNRPFIFALRGGYDLKEVEDLIMENGFEERIKERGLVIRGWAPQVLILSHPAVGGFLTHCGWNSTIEGLSAGVPMLTCPMFAEQFLNEQLIVNLLRVGVSVRSPNNNQDEGNAEIPAVTKEDVRRAVELVVNEGLQGKEMRERAQRFRHMAKKAVEDGGSSDIDMRAMIHQVFEKTDSQRDTGTCQ